MRPNASQLATRDPARAALFGAFDGADFGAERATSASPFGADAYGMHGDFGAEYGMGGEYGGEYGADMGAMAGEFGAQHRRHPHAQHGHGPQLTPEQKRILWEHAHRQHRGRERRMLIDPNAGSELKIERYTFSLFNNNGASLVLGTPDQSINYSGQPDVTIRPQRVIMNAPAPGFATIQEIKVANISATVGGNSDAFEYSPIAVGSHLNIPTISPANRATVLGTYSGYVPAGFVPGASFEFTVTFQGEATMTA